MSDYNYAGFSADQYDLVNFRGPVAGGKAPDFEVTTLNGERRNLLDFSSEFLVLELGSITCPLFQTRTKGMRQLKAEFPNVDHAVLYVREAHPGQNVPAHATDAEKRMRGQQLRDEGGETRDILLDSVGGKAHAAYGAYPNAVFIINKNGCVVYRSAWNNVRATNRALRRLLAGKPVHSEGAFIPALPPVALRTFKLAGRGAASDFFRGLPTLIWNNLIRRNLALLVGGHSRVLPDVNC